MSNIRNKIKEFKEFHQLYQRDNPLVSIVNKSIIDVSESPLKNSQTWEFICNCAAHSLRNEGFNPLFITQGIIILNYDNEIVKSPLLVCTVPETSFFTPFQDIIFDEERSFINPFLIHYFSSIHDFRQDWSETQWWEFFKQQKDFKLDYNQVFIGIFPMWKTWLEKEISFVERSSAFSSALQITFGEKDFHQSLVFDGQNILDLNFAQNKVVERIQDCSLFVEGPPGTGKTDTIINLLGRILQNDQKALVISEKRNGLKIIEERIDQLQLSSWVINIADFDSNKSFFHSIKTAWEKTKFIASKPVTVRTDKIADVEKILNIIFKVQSDYGLKAEQILSILHQSIMGQSASEQFKVLPDSWQKELQTFQNFDHDLWGIWHQLKLNCGILENPEQMAFLETVSSHIDKMKLNKDVPLSTLWSDVLIIQKFQFNIYQNFRLFLEKEKQWFVKNYSIFMRNQQMIEAAQSESAHWIKEPTQEEINYLKNLFQKQGFFQKIKQQLEWKKWVRTPALNPISTIKKMEKRLLLVEKRNTILSAFKLKGIPEETHLLTISQLIHTTNPKEWDRFQQLEDSYLKELHIHQHFIKTLYHLSYQLMNRSSEITLNEIQHLTNDSKTILGLVKFYHSLEVPLKQELIGNKNFENSINAISKKLRFEILSKYPLLFQWDVQTVLKQLREKSDELKNRQNDISSGVENLIRQRLESFEKLLLTPNTKLNELQRKLKNELKKGKALLVKEITKSKKFKNPTELLKTSASLWIYAIKPIWLSTPSQLGRFAEQKSELFDLVIFDEVSRIPLYQSMGALQRGKTTLLFGDSKQMGSSGFFQKSQLRESLQQHVKFYLPNLTLTEHYRSENKDVIQYSNENFYEGTLKIYPRHEIMEKKAIYFHCCENGYFDERKNIPEALMLVEYLLKMQENQDIIAVVAFSETQLNAIQSLVYQSKDFSPLWSEKINDGTLFFRTLENLQGEESDQLLISFGYGKNIDGEFGLQFGPLNRIEEINRINVLMTRSRKTIHLFSSCRSADIPLSKNPAVQQLKNWINYFENTSSKSIKRNQPLTSEISFHNFLSTHSNAQDAIIAFEVMEKRGWKIMA
jgi:hypothetical protein